MKARILLLLVIVSAIFIGCSKNKESEKNKQGKLTELIQLAPEQNQLQIVDDNNSPVAEAEILIGQAINRPFAGNLLKTDSNGIVTVPEQWNSSAAVSIRKPGYLTVTYLNQIPGRQNIFQIPTQQNERAVELSGAGTGFKIRDGDGIVDFAAMTEALDYTDLVDLSISKLISTEGDTIQVAGNKVDIPSNVSLPRQRESYFIGITLEKPKYRLYFPEQGQKYVYTFRGQFPFKRVIDEFQDGKPLHEMINYFSIQGGSLKLVDLTGPKNQIDIPVSELLFQNKVAVKAPALANSDVFMSVALSPFQNMYLPTDMKNFNSNETVQLTAASGEPSTVVTILTRNQNNSTLPRATSVTISEKFDGQFTQLPLISEAKVNANGEFQTKAPMLPANLQKLGAMATLFDVQLNNVNNKEVRTQTAKWVVYSADWNNQVELPDWEQNSQQGPSKKQMWEIQYLATKEQKTVDLGPRLLQSVTHASRVKVDF